MAARIEVSICLNDRIQGKQWPVSGSLYLRISGLGLFNVKFECRRFRFPLDDLANLVVDSDFPVMGPEVVRLEFKFVDPKRCCGIDKSFNFWERLVNHDRIEPRSVKTDVHNFLR